MAAQWQLRSRTYDNSCSSVVTLGNLPALLSSARLVVFRFVPTAFVRGVEDRLVSDKSFIFQEEKDLGALGVVELLPGLELAVFVKERQEVVIVESVVGF